MNESCYHNHKAPISVLKKLPITQAGLARHKCAVCAYEIGYLDGFNSALNLIRNHLPQSDSDILKIKDDESEQLVMKIASSIKNMQRKL